MGNLDNLIKNLLTRDPKVIFKLNEEHSAISILLGDLADPINVIDLRKAPFEHARRFLRENMSMFGKIDETNELIDEREMTNRRGMTHVIFQQKYGDALVMGGTISVHYGADGGVHLVKSNLASAIDVPKEPKIAADRAVEIAKKHAGEGASLYKNMKPILEVVDAKTLHLDDKPQRYYLCWKIGIIIPPGRQQKNSYYFVDALNGEIHLVYPTIQTGAGKGYYSIGAEGLNSERSGRSFRLRDTVTSSQWPVAKKPVIHTFDDNGSTDLELRDYSIDTDDNWNNGGFIDPLFREDDQREEVDLHRFMGHVLSYFYLTHGHNGWDNKGADLRGHAHNEYYSNNAFWDNDSHEIYFASGDGVSFNFMCSLDVVGHEFTHGVNQGFSIVQVYEGETGALNEGIADLFGALISLQHPGFVSNPWIQGLQYDMKSHQGRNMSNPSRDASGVMQYDVTNNATKYNSAMKGFYPDHYSIRYTDDLDNGGIHINCLIITHAVYLMINGGTHRYSNVSVIGIGVEPVEEMLYEMVSGGFLSNNSKFMDFYQSFILVCQILYPDRPDYLAKIKTAFHAVGLGSEVVEFTWQYTDVSKRTMKFIDKSINFLNSWYWEFGDGETSTEQNPTHKYEKAGKYKVHLIITAPYGSDKVTHDILIGRPPQAGFTYRYNDSTKKSVTFTDWSISEDSPIITWHWNFGDGKTSDKQNPSHSYKVSPKTYEVTLSIGTRSMGGDMITEEVYIGVIQ